MFREEDKQKKSSDSFLTEQEYVQKGVSKVYKMIFEKLYGPKLIRYSHFLKLKKEQPLVMLIQSLEKDGKFYGAEWEEETMEEYLFKKLHMVCDNCNIELKSVDEATKHLQENNHVGFHATHWYNLTYKS